MGLGQNYVVMNASGETEKTVRSAQNLEYAQYFH